MVDRISLFSGFVITELGFPNCSQFPNPSQQAPASILWYVFLKDKYSNLNIFYKITAYLTILPVQER